MFAAALRNIRLTKAEKAKIQVDCNGIAGAMLRDDGDPLAIEEIIVLIKPVVTAAEMSVGREGGVHPATYQPWTGRRSPPSLRVVGLVPRRKRLN